MSNEVTTFHVSISEYRVNNYFKNVYITYIIFTVRGYKPAKQHIYFLTCVLFPSIKYLKSSFPLWTGRISWFNGYKRNIIHTRSQCIKTLHQVYLLAESPLYYNIKYMLLSCCNNSPGLHFRGVQITIFLLLCQTIVHCNL